jgi:hypothetical protein
MPTTDSSLVELENLLGPHLVGVALGVGAPQEE